MADDYTPTDDEVMEAWAAHNSHDLPTVSDLVSAYDTFRRWLAEHDRQVAERAWDRCVGEMPIDPDWKNFYSDQNPYTKEEQS